MNDEDAHDDSYQSKESDDELAVLLEKIEPYWRDLLWQGAVVRKHDPSPTPTYRLKFRQVRSGDRNGKMKSVYIGKDKELTDRLMDAVWDRREQARTRRRPRGRRARAGSWAGIGEILDALRELRGVG